jgi:hypothetical protein
MTDRDTGITRRGFVTSGAGIAAGGLLGIGGRDAAADDTPSRSRVVLVRRENAVGPDREISAEVVHEMLNQSVAALLDEDAAPAAWKRLVGRADVVGIKSNEWGHLPTPPELEEAIRSEVLAVGVEEENVSIADRGVRSDPVFARATALINVRPMRTHHWSGLGTCLKNMISFVPRPYEYHGDACAPLGSIWRLPHLDGKVRLNVLVMLTPQFHGIGPHSFSKRFVWPYGGLIVSTDPVAADATGARIIAARRREFFGEDKPISPPPHHIQVADSRYGLGVSDPDRIDLVRLGPDAGALI